MKHIYKYPLTLGRDTDVKVGPTAKVVHVGEQSGDIMMWMELSDEDRKWGDMIGVARHFTLMATGEEIPASYIYCGTAICAQGRFVWHLYEVAD